MVNIEPLFPSPASTAVLSMPVRLIIIDEVHQQYDDRKRLRGDQYNNPLDAYKDQEKFSSRIAKLSTDATYGPSVVRTNQVISVQFILIAHISLRAITLARDIFCAGQLFLARAIIMPRI